MPSDVYALVLAAGLSRRYGRSKLLEEFSGTPLLRHALTAAQAACPGRVVLVTGHGSEDMASAASGLADEMVLNEAYRTGIGSSIAKGVSHLFDRATAVIIILADQPLVTAAHIGQIIEKWDGHPDAIVATRFSELDGPPVLFGRNHFDQLAELTGDAGAKQVLRAHPNAVRTVRFEPAAIDIDTPDDLKALLSQR
jgi:molybdenum cofactor cytidylyltransferase